MKARTVVQLETQLRRAEDQLRARTAAERRRPRVDLLAIRAQDAKPPARKPEARATTLKAIHPNAGLTSWLRRRLEAEIAAMHRSVAWWVGAAYRKEEERIELASDAAPADLLARVVGELRKRWGRRFDDLGERIAERFARRVGDQTDAAIEAALRAAGMRVRFQMTSAQRDQVAAAVRENVALIRSIPQQHFVAVEGAVMRSVSAGRDLASLATELERAHGVTRRRAAFISRDQNAKATAALNRTRQIELEITEAVWVHSGAGKHPRPTHVKAGRDKVVYRVDEGWLDPALGRRIWPGTEPNCRCVCRSVIPGVNSEARRLGR